MPSPDSHGATGAGAKDRSRSPIRRCRSPESHGAAGARYRSPIRRYRSPDSDGPDGGKHRSPIRRCRSRSPRFRHSDRHVELHRTIATLREENRDVNVENTHLKHKADKLVADIEMKDKKIRHMQEVIYDLHEVERQLSHDLSDAHTSRINEQNQLQAEIDRILEDKKELQTSKDEALSTAMAVLQRALDEDKPRKQFDTVVASASRHGITSPQDGAPTDTVDDGPVPGQAADHDKHFSHPATNNTSTSSKASVEEAGK